MCPWVYVAGVEHLLYTNLISRIPNFSSHVGHQITNETKGRAELRDTGSPLTKTVRADMGFKVDLLLSFIGMLSKDI